MYPLKPIITIIVCLFSLTSYSAEQEKVKLTIRAILVEDSLELKPIPRMPIQVISLNPNSKKSVEAITSFTGVVELHLEPGKYNIQSKRIITFMDSRYRWDETVELSVGKDLEIELSNDNAIIEGEKGLQKIQYVASDIYKKYESGVMTIEGEGSNGTGFLIDTNGLILTNEHVVSGSRFFSVELSNNIRYPAQLIYSDKSEDIAILRISPEIAKNLIVLPFAEDSPTNTVVRSGEPVFAIGSPLSQDIIITAGIASKVEDGVIISDVLIDHGNSGGPLLNSKGNVIGINTFGEGKGTSGSIRTWKAFSVIDEAKKRLNSMSIPSSEPLLNYPEGIYPSDAIQTKILSEDFRLADYRLNTRKFTIYILTPPALAYFENEENIKAALGRDKRRKRKKVKGEDTLNPTELYGDWAQYVDKYKPIVRVFVTPKQKATVGSAIASGFLGASVIQYQYAGDFDKITLYRANTASPHIRIGRSPIKNVFGGAQGSMNDAAYQGWVDYMPDSFKPPINPKEEVYFNLINEVKPDKNIVEKIPTTLLKRIWEDFSLLRVPVAEPVPEPVTVAPKPEPVTVAPKPEPIVIAPKPKELSESEKLRKEYEERMKRLQNQE